MIKEINDINEINKFLSYFNTSISEIGIFSHYNVYKEDNEIIGFLNYDLIYDRIEIIYIYVNSNFRKRGIASKLIEDLINIGKKNNCKNITLEVNTSNKDALSLYKHNGFIEVAKREKYYNGEDGILMVRELV